MASIALPASPKGHFLSGNLPDYRRDPLGFFRRCAQEYGDFVPLRFGPVQAVLLNHPDLVEELLVTNYRNVIKGRILRNSPLLGNGLLTSEGDFWRRQRKLAQPAFHRERIAAYGAQMVACAERRMADWQDGETRDMHAEMMRLTLDIVVSTLFGGEVEGKAGDVGSLLHFAQDYAERRMKRLFLVPPWLPTPDNLRLRHITRRLDGIIYGLIDERRNSPEERDDLLSMLLHAQDEDDGTGMTDRQLRDEVMTLFLAGHETTALALSWAWYLLAQHPEIEAKLADELRSVLNGRPPTVADRASLPYTERVALEVMRLYPPAWAVSREVVQECEIGGRRIPPGTIVLVCQWAMHRDPRYYDEPDSFNPDRWANDFARRLPKYAYFPFGGGPRVCIGNTFAMMEMTLLLAAIAPQFRFRLVPNQTIKLQPAITLRPEQGIRMTICRR
jgi:cytochrome P450